MDALDGTEHVDTGLSKILKDTPSLSHLIATGLDRKPLPKLEIRGHQNVKLYEPGNRASKLYGFGFVVTNRWLEHLSVDKGICRPGHGTIAAGLRIICDKTGMKNYSVVSLRLKDPTMPTLACLVWIANNLVPWAMEMANDREMVEKLKDAFETDMEPQWYRSGLGGYRLKRPKQNPAERTVYDH